MKQIPKQLTLKEQIRTNLLAMEVGGQDVYPVDNVNFSSFLQTYYMERKALADQGTWHGIRDGYGEDEMFIIIRIK